MTFDEHTEMISRVLRLKWFKTKLVQESFQIASLEQKVIDNYPRTKRDGKTFGSFAIRQGGGFLTSTRGKMGSGVCFVLGVDFDTRVVSATQKATLNAPTLARIFEKCPQVKYILHDHAYIVGALMTPHSFPGTTEELERNIQNFGVGKPEVNIRNHGYIKTFSEISEVLDWIRQGAKQRTVGLEASHGH